MQTTALPITSKELLNLKEEHIILDIRPKQEFDSFHIKGSINIDIYEEIYKQKFHDAAEKLTKLPNNKKIITICNAGISSQTASQMLYSQGKESLYLEGGMKEWSNVHKDYKVLEADDLFINQIARIGKGCLSYLIGSKSKKECIIVDPSQFIEKYDDLAKELGLKIKGVIDTHVHADHLSGGKALASIMNCEFYTPNDNKSFTRIKDGDNINLNNTEIKVIGTPGHTEESVSLIIADKAIITGDTLFLDGVGRPDLSSKEETKKGAESLYDSTQKLFQMDGNLLVLPAHFQDSVAFPVMKKISDIMSNNLFKNSKEDFVNKISSNLQETPPNHKEIKQANESFTIIPRMQAEHLEFGPNRCAAK